MESEALDKRMVREATIGLVVLVALIGLLFVTIWLKAKTIWADAREDLLTTPVNVYALERGNVLVATKKPSPVPLPEVESNQIVDLGEMRRISPERMAALFGTSGEVEPIRVAIADTDSDLPGVIDPPLPSPLPLNPQPLQTEALPISPLRDRSESSESTLPALPSSGESERPLGLPRLGATTNQDILSTAAIAGAEPTQNQNEPIPATSEPTRIAKLPIATTPISTPPNSTTPISTSPIELPPPSLPPPSLLPTSLVPTSLLPRSRLPTSSSPSLPDLPSPIPVTEEAFSKNHATDVPLPQLESQQSVMQVAVQSEVGGEAPKPSSPEAYTAEQLKAAMRRVRLPQGMSMAQLSLRLYGDARYAGALQQLNHRRADDRGRFLPGTQIAYLPGEMLAFVYPDLVHTRLDDEELGVIQPVQYEEPRGPVLESSPVRQEVVSSPLGWILTEGGESLFQLAVDHFDQASYYLQLYEWNRATFEGRYRPTDPLPKGLRIRLAPPDPAP
jgi:hypothetical protein